VTSQFRERNGTICSCLEFRLVENVGKRTVCLVKDDPFLRLEALVVLEEAGIPVAGFAAPERALAYLANHADEVCLLVAEVRFPSRLSEVELARQVAAKWPWIKVAVTAAPEAIAEAQIPAGAIVTTRSLLPTDLLAHAFQASREKA
jgi:DNA-binding NtrC family response regulator